jgi:hypothetical protein
MLSPIPTPVQSLQSEGLVVKASALEAAEANITWPAARLQAVRAERANTGIEEPPKRGKPHKLLRWFENPRRRSAEQKRLLARAGEGRRVGVSDITLWEVAARDRSGEAVDVRRGCDRAR